MFIEGKDYGDAEMFFAKGRKLRDLVKVCHVVATGAM